MNLHEAFLLLFTHGLPILFFAYMATDVLLRNSKRVEHILLSLISICYLLLFMEEYVRNQVLIEYSPTLSALWLSSVGIMIPSLCIHFFIKITRIDATMHRFIYPYIFYIPLIFVVFNIATGAQFISSQQFIQSGIWKLPEYNSGYYMAMTVSILSNLFYLIPLLFIRSRADIPEQKAIYNQLIIGVILAALLHIVFGYINYGDSLPPYPYLYIGIGWCYFLGYMMKKHDVLNLYDKRYEKLFDMNPDAILLVNSNGDIKNVNPSATQLFDSLQLGFVPFFEMLEAELKTRIQDKLKINQVETEIIHNNRRIVFLVSADYVWVDNEQHVLLIVRDNTVQKEYQEEIQLLAYHDPLTRLPNRRYFHEKLDEALQQSEFNKEILALMLIDLDHIKWLNDNLGHYAGDEALQSAAVIIQEIVATDGITARMGGDEFILFINPSPSSEEIHQKISQMQEKFSQYLAKYGATPVGMSIGVSYYPVDGLDGQALINRADNAMFEMKRSRY